MKPWYGYFPHLHLSLIKRITIRLTEPTCAGPSLVGSHTTFALQREQPITRAGKCQRCWTSGINFAFILKTIPIVNSITLVLCWFAQRPIWIVTDRVTQPDPRSIPSLCRHYLHHAGSHKTGFNGIIPTIEASFLRLRYKYKLVERSIRPVFEKWFVNSLCEGFTFSNLLFWLWWSSPWASNKSYRHGVAKAVVVVTEEVPEGIL